MFTKKNISKVRGGDKGKDEIKSLFFPLADYRRNIILKMKNKEIWTGIERRNMRMPLRQ